MWLAMKLRYGGAASSVAALGLALMACSGTPGSDNPMPDMALSPDLAGGYPAGPYGASGSVNPGDTLPNLTFQGYWSPTRTTGLASEEPYGAVTFEQLHNSGAKYAIVMLAAFW